MIRTILQRAAAALTAAALLAGAPLRAQPEIADAPIPRTYPSTDANYAYPLDDPARIARERQTADANAAQCASGEAPSACTALGLAFRDGEGRPQNRPVAELIFREACAADEPTACAELGAMLRDVAKIDTLPHARFIARACALGKLSACTEHARLIEAGVGQPADINAADAVRARACDGGDAASCLALAQSLTDLRRAPEKRAAGVALIDRLCRTGDRQACGLGARLFGSEADGDPARARAYRESACTNGDAWGCNALAQEALRTPDTEVYGEGIARALRFFDLACAGVTSACRDARALRTEPALQRDCDGGARAACFQLSELYRDRGGVLEDPQRALWLLAWLCETASDNAERRTTCGAAGMIELDTANSDRVNDPVRAEALLTRGCDAGEGRACLDLARELAEGERLPQDLPRSHGLFDTQCAAGASEACNWLARNIDDDPATPLVLADADYTPPEDEDSEAEVETAPANAPPNRRRPGGGTAASRQTDPASDNCTTTTAEYRGITYTDTICPNVVAVFRGTPVLAGTTPWQALIWRPDRIGSTTVGTGYKVLCGGAVIRTGWVLTAAHCLEDQGRDIATTGHRIRLGVSNPLVPDQGHSYPILRTHKPKQFVGGRHLLFDIALIEYDPRAGQRGAMAYDVRSITMDPKPFAARQITDGTRARVYGWGSTTVAGSTAPPVLLQGKVLLRAGEACNAVTDFRRFPQFRDSVLCGDGVGGQQACKGDSGGPVIMFEPTVPGGRDVPVLVGVVSSGVDCGTRSLPSRYTRLTHPVVQQWLSAVLPGAGARAAAR